MRKWNPAIVCHLLTAGLVLDALNGLAVGASGKILSVTSDATADFYGDFNRAFADYWQRKTGAAVQVDQSAGGSGEQADAVANGLEADVVTLDEPREIDQLHTVGHWVAGNWASRLPNHSVPYRSTIVFLVRQGNPKHLQNWDDLVRSGVSLVVPNPKTSEVGKYSYLAAWGYASRRPGADKSAAVRFVGDLFAHAPVLDPNARGAATTFAERGIGDALLVLESDAARLQRDFPAAGFEIEVPAESILAEDVVAWVDRNVERHHTENLARAYLQFLYSPAGQELAAKDFLRPENKAVLAKYAGQFKPIALFTVQDVAGGWEKAQQDHFSDGGIFDQIRQRN